MNESVMAPTENIEVCIKVFRNRKVILDADLAALYEVETKMLNRAVRRNLERFPPDFMFELTAEEFLRCQSGTSKGRGGRRHLPLAFTEQGVAMLSGLLTSSRAVHVNIAIMRAFVRIREILNSEQKTVDRMNGFELKLLHHDRQFQKVFEALARVPSSPRDLKTRERIGFGRNPVRDDS